MAVDVNETMCVGCGCCVDVCPEGALELDDSARVIEDECTECESCVPMCPADALTL